MAEGGDYIYSQGKGRGLPYGTPTERTPLRQPSSNVKLSDWHNSTQNFIPDKMEREAAKTPRISEPQSTNELLNNCDEVAKDYKVPDKKGLSPNAKEFVPRSTYLSLCSSNHQNEDENESSYAPLNNFEDTHCDSFYDDIIVHVKDMMDDLAINPGKFDTIVDSLLTMLVSDLSSSQTLKAVVDIIFDGSVLEPNLRYNGARLCNHLSQNLLSEDGEKIFRTLLIHRCQQELSQTKDYIRVEDGTIVRLDVLGKNLIEQLILLMSNPVNTYLKCVVQVLKFTGAALEEQHKVMGSTSEMNRLAMLIEKQSYINQNGNIKEMLQNVLQLRENNWGQTRTSPAQCEEPFMGDFPFGEPVLYGPDGQPITIEETQFLESNQHLYEEEEYPDYGEYPPGEWSTEDDQMDDEIAAAYEEFLAQHPGCNQLQNS